ncbi:virulence factor TspB C-terminal domain-related protein [Acinetobacter lactucae]|uniref:virulence factor TspB C-terminal domain-related protein n=1 Tax=Acinetobacter lactucae TaxID=1785128 RepID=UPI0015807A02|nr:virulence factor TspB C-terminal domain-related protein [Acinetobacter lactucae]NUG21899.1 hypothetical protein [Acinetobacter lactucae]
MVNRLSFRNLRFDNFKLITWLQIFIIAIAPNFIFYQVANATTVGAEGWSVSKTLVQGATTTYNGVKNVVLNGKSYAATGVAKVTPTASQVGKMIVRTGAVLAVDLAIKSLIGAVDYVMDPANNRVKYYVDPAGNAPQPTDQYMWRFESSVIGVATFAYPSVPTSICQSVLSLWSGKHPWYYNRASVSSSSQIQIVCYLSSTTTSYDGNSGVVRVNNPAYDPNAQLNREEKYLPYDAVGTQIISDAVSEKAEGKAYVSSVADTALDSDEQRQIVGADVVNQQLNNSQSIATNGTATGTSTPNTGTGDPEAPTAPPSDITLNFPVFCDWAPTVCSAAQAAINFPGTVAGYWNNFNKWLNESASDTSETKPEIKDLSLNFDDGSRVTFDQTCPQPQPIQLTFMGVSQDASFSYEPLCNFMIMIRPFVIGSAYLIGAYIVMGLSRGNSE